MLLHRKEDCCASTQIGEYSAPDLTFTHLVIIINFLCLLQPSLCIKLKCFMKVTFHLLDIFFSFCPSVLLTFCSVYLSVLTEAVLDLKTVFLVSFQSASTLCFNHTWLTMLKC